MKKTLLFALALAVIPVGVVAQVTPSAFCAGLADLFVLSSLDDPARDEDSALDF